MTEKFNPFQRVREVTTLEQRALLKGAGFIHVTGLRCFNRTPVLNSPYAGFDLKASDLGTYFRSYTGFVLITTTGGELWLGVGNDSKVLEPVFASLCPYGTNKYSGGLDNPEWYRAGDLLARNAVPDYIPVFPDVIPIRD